MASSFAVEDRNYLRQHYFEARDRGDATAVAHAQALLGERLFSPQHRSSEERASLIGVNLFEVMPKQLFAQARDTRPNLLSEKMIADLTQGKPLSSRKISAIDTSLAKAITSNKKYVWYRLGDAFSCESTVMQFWRSFFTSYPMRAERPIQSYLILRIIDLTLCQQEVDPAPGFLDEMRYLVMCKVQHFANIKLSEMEEELEEVAAGQREFSKEFLQVAHQIREKTASLWGKLSAVETRPLLCGEEMRFVKQALNLYETEVSHAMALDKVTGQQDYAEELRCMMALGKLYAKKREKQALIQSADMFNYAWRLIEDPQYLPAMQMDARHARRIEILSALGQVELQLLRLMGIKIASPQIEIERARACILANRENLQERRKIIDREIAKLGEEPSPQQIADVNCLIANLMKVFTAQLIEQCIATLGKEPCPYAVIGLGSMAREEMTHYSDLEFAILIEEGAEQHKEYFRNLTYLFHLKVVNLGETLLPNLNVPCLNGESGIGFFDSVTPRGFAFDGAGVQGKGCKTPLGNGTTFELIQTPKEMAQYLGRDNDGVDWPESEPHLPMELLNFTLICASEEKLIEDYQKALHLELSNPYRKGVNLRNYLARMHLVSDDERLFDPTLGNLEKEGQLFKVKQDLYRFPHLSIDRLALLSNLQVLSTFDRIKELNRIGILNATASKRLQWLICIALFQRLKVYSHYKAQQEFMNPLIKTFLLEDPQLIQKQFALDRKTLKTLTKIYQILIPFYKAIKAYLKENSFILQKEILWDESDFTLGKIASRLLQYEQARAYYLKVQDSSLEDIARKLLALGTVESRLGKEQEALSRFQESLIIREKIHGKEHPDIVISLNNIGNAYHCLGKAEEALAFHQRALTIWEKVYGKEHSITASILSNIGSAYHSLGKAKAALSFFQRALIIWEKIYEKEHPFVAMSLNNIGGVYHFLGKAQEALSFYQKALTIWEKIYGKGHPDVATSLNNIGRAYHTLGKAEKALSFCQKALTIREKIFGKEHPHVASSLINIGGVYSSLEKAEKALSFYKKALTIREKIYGQEHPDVATSLNNIGRAYHTLGKAEEALSFHKRAMTIQEKIYGKEHPHVATSLNNIGGAYDFLGKAKEALSFHKRALTIQEKIYGKEHSDVATSLNNIGGAYDSLGQAKEALSFYQRALTILEKIFGKEHPHVAISLNNIGDAYNSLGRAEEALSFYQRALTIREKIYGKEHPHVATSLNDIGMVYRSLKNAQKALPYFQRALAIREKIHGKEHPHVATSLNNIGAAYHSVRKTEEVLPYFQRALAIWEKIYGKEHPYVATSLNNIGAIYHFLRKTEEALPYLQKALTILEKIYGKDHPDVAMGLSNIGGAYYRLGDAKKALLYSQKALTILEKIYGNEHPRIIETRKNAIAAAYQAIEHPQQTIDFILAKYREITVLA